MVTNAAQQTQDETNPLEQLQGMLWEDMKQVNRLILDNMQSDVALIPQLAAYLIAAGGKRIRPLLTLAATRLYGDESDRCFRLAAAVEFIHTATLLHDDVVDESTERRGQKTANVVFGNQPSVLVGDFLFSRAFQLMVADGSLDVLRILSDASAIIAQGEVMQLSTANNLDTTLDDYEQVIKSKTAALFAAACEIGPIMAGKPEADSQAMADFGMNLGIAFQIADDVLDYNAEKQKLGKTIGDDFREGKMTAPVILAYQQATPEERDFWTRTIARREQKDGDLEQALAIFERTNALKKGMAYAEHFAELAHKALMNAPANRLRDCLEDVLRFSVQRDH